MSNSHRMIPISCLIACSAGKTPDLTICPSWAGKENTRLESSDWPPTDPYFNLEIPPFEVMNVAMWITKDDEMGFVNTNFSWEEDLESQQYDLVVDFEGSLSGYCDSNGYFETGRTTTWLLEDAFERVQQVTSVTTTWDPPILTVPADMDVGAVWTIDSIQTTVDSRGDERSVRLLEVRTVTSELTMNTRYGTSQVRVIESSTGRTWMYSEKYGLVRGDGLTLINTGNSVIGYDD